jgi:tetratricopeptide (TPR) repeat protein
MDGSAPPEPVKLERVCNAGRARPEGYTDPHGSFSITLGQETGILPDASESPIGREVTAPDPSRGIRQTELMTCELRAVLPGYRSDTIPLANRRYMDTPDIGTIVLRPLMNVEGLTTSATSALAPKDAKKAFDKGLESVKKNNPDEAQKSFQKATETYPRYAAAWFELGRIYEQRDHFVEARNAYNQAITSDDRYINPYERLYMMAFNESKWQEVADITDRVAHLNPYDYPQAYYYNAVANLKLEKYDAAEKSAREAVKLDAKRQNPKANYVLGVILTQKRDYTAAAECLRAYLKDAPNAPDADRVKKLLAEVEKFAQAKNDVPQ